MIKDKTVLKRIASIIREAQMAEGPSAIHHLKKLSVSTDEYRVRIGDYRIGLIITGKTIEFIRCLHRKDIYKYFPK